MIIKETKKEEKEQFQEPEQSEQQQRDQQAVNETRQKLKIQKDNYKKNLKLLHTVLTQASPIFETIEKSTVGKDKNGNEIDISYSNRIVTNYSYNSIDGKQIEDWVQETFNGKVTLNKKTKEIKIQK